MDGISKQSLHHSLMTRAVTSQALSITMSIAGSIMGIQFGQNEKDLSWPCKTTAKQIVDWVHEDCKKLRTC